MESGFWKMMAKTAFRSATFSRCMELPGQQWLILTTSNFADFARHPERGIMFFENTGQYTFQPYAFTIASGNQWNLMATGDLNRDGWPDVIIGAMNLGSIAKMQRRFAGRTLETEKDAVLFLENRMRARSPVRPLP